MTLVEDKAQAQSGVDDTAEELTVRQVRSVGLFDEILVGWELAVVVSKCHAVLSCIAVWKV